MEHWDIHDQPHDQPHGKYRSWLPDLTAGKFKEISRHDAHTWADEFYKNPFAKELTKTWFELWEKPFVGITIDGSRFCWTGIENIYENEDQDIDMPKIVASADNVLKFCTPEQSKALLYPVNARQWRSWSNPEIYISKYGLRLDEVSTSLAEAVLGVIKATISLEGYAKVVDIMRINHFLGTLVEGPKVLNQYSYNFIIFGQPSNEQPWGWNIYGHHFCMCVYLQKQQMMIAPVFLGAEPNEIDDGPWQGTAVMREEERLGLSLMQSLSITERQKAQVYKEMRMEEHPPGRWNEADQRHLAGAFQDNRVIPYEGIQVSTLSRAQIDMVFSILKQMHIYLPEPIWEKRKAQMSKYLGETWFCWIGGYGDEDPFYYRLQSPVVLVEFDHHSGVFLRNTEPEKYHIHTIIRAPNGGDYGNAIRSPAQKLD